MANKNVSIPDSLRAEMDSVADKINWSAVAQDAFHRAILDNRIREKGMDIDSVAERLRLSAKQENDEDYAAGLAEGKQWASLYAQTKQLRLINKYYPDTDWTLDAFLKTTGIDSAKVGDVFGETDQGLPDWDKLTDSFIGGFVDGALEVWDKVQNLI